MAIDFNDVMITPDEGPSIILASGISGATPSISIGNVETVAPSSGAGVTMSGTITNPVLNFQIPRGVAGYEAINDSAGEGDTDYVWSADKTYNEILSASDSNIGNDDFSSFAGIDKPLAISETLSSGTSTYDFTNIRLCAGVEYSIWCAEAVPSTPIRLYVPGETTNYVGLQQGWNRYVPTLDGYVRISNQYAQYSGSLTLSIYTASNFLRGNYKMVTSAATLSSLTNGTKSCDDFPVNQIITIGTETDIGLLNPPTISYPKNAGTYCTFYIRGVPGAGQCQIFISNGGHFFWRMKWASGWTNWSTTIGTSNKMYTTREAWLADFPTDKLGDIPAMELHCIGAGSVNPSDGPYANFMGQVITLSYSNEGTHAGCYQFAFGLDDVIYYRRYIYSGGVTYWGAWMHSASDETVYHVGTGQTYTSLSALLLDLKGQTHKKVIYVHEGTYDIFQEYLDLVTAERLTIPPDDAITSDYIQYSVFVPNNTRIVGLGNVVLQMTPASADVTAGESHMWSPINCEGNIELENLKVLGKNCRYCLHPDHITHIVNSKMHIKNCKFIYTLSDMKDGERLGYNNTIGFGMANGATHIYDDCEIIFDGAGNYAAYYGHENAAGHNGTLILRNCIIKGSDYTDNRVIRLQTLSTTEGYVKAYFENCYMNGGLMLDLYNDASRNNFDVTFINCNKLPVTRYRSKAPSVPVVDPYTVKWYNPLPIPTAQSPQYETDSI